MEAILDFLKPPPTPSLLSLKMTRLWLSLLVLAIVVRPALAGEAADAAAPVYEGQVRAVFKANCFQCHGEEGKPKGGLDLRLRGLIVKGGKSGPAVEPGDPDNSLLYQRVLDAEMPPGDKKKLTAAEIELIGRWIAAGARTSRPEPETVGTGFLISEEERQHWSFRPIHRPGLPAVNGQQRVRTAVDAFLLARLERDGLTFAPDADKRTLIRRATFDLTGLPPTPEEVETFLADDSDDAYGRLLDRLLASPRYGERWGRHWLDVAGYADSEGYTVDDPVRPSAFKYRDYVVRSFNADKPFDQFVVEQLAGDETVAPPYEKLGPEAIEALVATGFLRTAPDGTGATVDDAVLARNQTVAETLKIVSTSLLGVTVGCAQCHDHRFDPISHVDYHRLRAIFEPALDPKDWRSPQQREIVFYNDDERRQADALDRQADELQHRLREKEAEYIDKVVEAELKKVPEDVRDALRSARATPQSKRTREQADLLIAYPKFEALNSATLPLYLLYALGEEGTKARTEIEGMAADVGKLRRKKPAGNSIRALTENPGQVPTTYLFHRGDPTQPKEAVPPGELTVLATDGTGDLPADDPALPTTGRRLAYARRLTDGKHPLVARVLVNRFWLHHFGRGIVGTPGDFGTQGERPTHPELLDWLADEFMAGGWRLKRVHKLIMTATAYRQSSRRDPRQDALDADNHLLGRMPVRRLEAEAFRDAILAVSGRLEPAMFGAPVPVSKNDLGEVVVGLARGSEFGPTEAAGGEGRRSLYVQVRRSQPPALLETFDAPLMEPNCELRCTSTVTPQALLLLNSRFVLDQARAFAGRVRREAGDDPRAQVARAWLLAFARAPAETETAAVLAFLDEQRAGFAAAPAPAPPAARTRDGRGMKPAEATPADPALRALAALCQTLFGSIEFLYVE